ncbi:MAG: DNA mismatch repair protein MutS [Selenomonadaceae bacterium]|nr:DNA mismatch repair protein MutS [Selenomonadaceae bacterium]
MAVTPMMQQYFEAKKQHEDALLFFQLGDFYEMFYDDAKVGAAELGLTLTQRSGAPMCGMPHDAGDTYIERLVAKGYKVAVVEQISDPKEKGLTDRALIKVVTPGTILTDDTLHNAVNNYIALVLEAGNEIALAGADISTGECFYDLYAGADRDQQLFDELYRLSASELLIVDVPTFKKKLDEFLKLRLQNCTVTRLKELDDKILERLSEHFDEKFIPVSELAARAVAALLDYLHKTVMKDLKHLSKLARLDVSDRLQLDSSAMRNLEITRNVRDGSKRDTLFGVLDKTKTPMGTRLLRKWIEAPLIDINAINRRLDCVEEFFKSYSLRNGVRDLLKDVRDIERLIMKVEIGSANAVDLTALKFSFRVLPKLRASLNEVHTDILLSCRDGLGDYDELAELINRAIIENAGHSIRDGGIIRDGFDDELDEYRRIARDSKTMLAKFEDDEKRKTGIKALKVGYNRVFGYYIEVRNSGASKVPTNYIRKQTLTNAERYITPELRDFETKILGAQEKSIAIEYALFVGIRDKIKARLDDIQKSARRIAFIDVAASLAEAAAGNNYIRPELRSNGRIEIKDGRHPLVERILRGGLFVPNDTRLDHNACELMIITGPNMAGKSTYMRQVALITLMAQMGSFVPAREAAISPVDKIFTRIGASDDLVSGQSTFMVEMNEVAQILKYATENSLIILDEVGRGTSTFDGMSIARSVIEYIEKKIHAKTLFATHYHELTTLADSAALIKNYCVAVKERGNEIIFLRRIKAGGADKSYGIQVARLAGLPQAVMKRAAIILSELEQNVEHHVTPSTPSKPSAPAPSTESSSLFASELADELLKLDVTTLTPIEAMNILYRLQDKARKQSGAN